jgi:hypothetical protein
MLSPWDNSDILHLPSAADVDRAYEDTRSDADRITDLIAKIKLYQSEMEPQNEWRLGRRPRQARAKIRAEIAVLQESLETWTRIVEREQQSYAHAPE